MDGNLRLWRFAGGLALAHVVLMFGSFALQRVADLDATPATVTRDFVSASATKSFAGLYLTLLSFLVFLLVATLLARLLRREGDLGGWLSGAISASGAVYVAVTLATELTSLGVAVYGGHHRAPLATITAFDQLHWFGVFAATAVLGVFTLCVVVAVFAGGVLPRWLGVTGLVPGVLCLACAAGPRTDLVGGATLLWAVWFVALAVSALRGPASRSAGARSALATT